VQTIALWTGREVKALRAARRMSVREFAEHLGVSDRIVSKWEAGGESIRPRVVNQAALDTSLAGADPETQLRFERLAGTRLLRIETIGTSAAVRHVVRHPVDGKAMTLIEAGPFARPGEAAVWLPAFYIDILPTRNRDFAEFVSVTGHHPPAAWTGGSYPDALADSPVQVGWVDAQAYATWASKSMPTVVQWERATRGSEGVVSGSHAEWCSTPRGLRRHEPAAGAAAGQPSFRCVLALEEMLALLAI